MHVSIYRTAHTKTFAILVMRFWLEQENCNQIPKGYSVNGPVRWIWSCIENILTRCSTN